MNRYAKISPNGHYSERFKELELAIHSLSNNTQSLGISYIVNKGNHNKKFILSIIKFLKEIGWLVQDENGKNIIITKETEQEILGPDDTTAAEKEQVLPKYIVEANQI
jgi:predicted transcriptional regulator